jgi:hypothetical protein
MYKKNVARFHTPKSAGMRLNFATPKERKKEKKNTKTLKKRHPLVTKKCLFFGFD